MMTKGAPTMRYALLVALIALLALNFAARPADAAVANPQIINVIVTNIITNSTITNALLSNSTFLGFISNSSQVLGEFLNSSYGVNATITNPAISSVATNGTDMLVFISNPSFSTIIQNPSLFGTLINDTPVAVLDSPAALACLLANPGLSSLEYYPSGLQSLFVYASGPSATTLSTIEGNPGLLCAFLQNPGLAGMVSNTTTLIDFLGAVQSSPISSSPLALQGLLYNPSLPGMINNATFYTFLSSSSLGTLIAYPQFINLTSRPDFAGLATNPAVVGILSQDPGELTNFFGNSQFDAITNTPGMLDSLMFNPSFANVLNAQSESSLAGVLADNSLGGAGAPLSNKVVLAGFLANPDLPQILNNTAGLTCLTTIPALDNNATFSIIFENPNVTGILSGCPTAINLLLANLTLEEAFQNPYTYTAMLESANLGQILNYPSTFLSFFSAQDPGISSILVSTSEFAGFINNPSLGNVLTDPSSLTTFSQNPNLAQIVDNNYYFSSLLANPGLSAALPEQSQMQSLLQNSQLTPIANDPIALGNMMGNPSLACVLNNQGQLGSFISDPAFMANGNVINSSVFEQVMTNPKLCALITNQSAFDSFYSNPTFSGIATSNVLLGSFLSNQNVSYIISNPSLLSGLLSTPQLGLIFGNLTSYANFLANPGLTIVINNITIRTNLEQLLNNLANTNFLNSGSLPGLLKNPSLTVILGSPQNFAQLNSMLSSPNFVSLYGNPTFGAVISSPQLSSLLSNQAFSSIFDNPVASSLINNLGQSLITGTIPTNFAGLPVPSILKNPAISALISVIANGGVFSSSSLGGFASIGALGTSTLGLAVIKSVVNILGAVTGNGAFLPLGSVWSAVNGGAVGGVLSSASGFLGAASALSGMQSAQEGGSYFFQNETIVQTNYTHHAGSGSIQLSPTGQFAIPLGTGSPSPLIESVLNYNIQSAQWLITCPIAPNPDNSSLYFTTGANSFIGGNRCLANVAPLETPIVLYTAVVWTSFLPAQATNYYTVANPATGFISDIAYSGETLTQGSSGYNISSGYDTESYIFDQIPSSYQQALWSWSAKYANFSATNTMKLVYTNTFNSLVYQIPDVCQWNYNFHVFSALSKINNTNITVPQFNKSAYAQNSWLVYGGYFFSPVKKIDISGEDCGPQLENGISCGDWSLVSDSASLDVSGSVYNGLNTYWGISGFSSDPDADYGNTLMAVQGSSGYEVDAAAINYTKVNIVPYINYLLSIPTTYSPLSRTVTYYNQSIGVYNPHNYILDPANYLDALSLYGNDGFFANYNGVLQEFPLNVTAVYNETPNSLNIHTPFFLSVFNLATAKTIGFGQNDGNPIALGHFVLGQIQNPAYITASRNGYIYVINYSTDCPLLCSISSTTSAYLFTLKYIPEGYYNFSNYQPADIPFTSNAVTWNSEWKGYFSNTLLGSSQDLYIIEIDKLSGSTVYSPFGLFATGKGGILNNFVPLAAQTDDNGDLFFLGARTSGSKGTFEMAGALPPGSNNWVENTAVVGVPTWQYGSQFIPSSEFAVSPGGQYVYVANASDPGQIEVFSTFGFSTTTISTTTSSTSTTASTTTTTINSNSITTNAVCPNQVYPTAQGTGGSRITFQQAVACAQAAGFSGQQLEIIVSAAAGESAFAPGATGAGISGGCTAQGILQEGKCGAAGEAYTLSDYNPSSCSTYAGSWSNIYYNPMCAFQWAAAFVAVNPPITQKGCTQTAPNGGVPFCFWGTYWVGGAYCKYMPTTYTGYNCARGGGGLPWSSVGIGCSNGASDTQCTVCADGTLVVDEPHNVCPPSSTPGSGGTGTVAVSAITVNGFIFSGNIPLSYSNNAYSMNIVQYLADGGPYDDPAVAAAYSAANAQTPDYGAFHHPVSITDSKGIIYVVDNWSFSVWQNNDNQISSSILMLRAFGENGTEIPINPSLINTFIPTYCGASCPASAVGGSGVPGLGGANVPAGGWPPYGWPLSANIVLPGGNTISYCALDCTYDAGNAFLENTPYQPLGPKMEPFGGYVGPNQNSLVISSDFNGTLYFMAHPYSYETQNQRWLCKISSSQPNWLIGVEIGLGLPSYVDCKDTVENPLYSELLVINPNLQNYTKLSYLDNASYICYLNQTPQANSPCDYNLATNALQYINPPVLGVPNAFGFVENLGGPEQYLNVQNELSAIFPTGVNSSKYQSQSNSELANGLQLGGSTYANLGTTQLSGTASKLYIPSSYLKSSLNGYVIVPYKTVLILNTSYKTTGVPQILYSSTDPVSLAVVEAACTAAFEAFDLLGRNTTTNSLRYSVASLQSGSGLNISIEGGGTYLRYIPQETYYIQNLSDAGAIMYPYIDYQIFTNRLFGNIYVNQTVSPITTGAQASGRPGLPTVINVTNLYTYQQETYQQISTFGTNNAYNISLVIPTGSSSGPSFLNGLSQGNAITANSSISSHFTYNNSNVTQFFELFEQFKESQHVASLVLNLTNNTSSFGYNRLLYTYVDRFNNTIYMPLDVDFANMTVLSLNSSTKINPNNENQTNVTVNGTATYFTFGGFKPIPSGSNIYLYWDTNINYYNTVTTSTASQQGYFTSGLLCAIAPQYKCQIANPLSTLTQNQSNGAGAAEANLTDYNPEAGGGTGGVSLPSNGVSSGFTGTCSPPPNSLLQQVVYDCNIYGYNSLPAVQQDPNAGSSGSGSSSDYQYCIPFFVNGTGLFSSQLGLIKVVKTNANGTFSDSFSACGVGQNRVIAQYYGAAGPEPMLVNQTALSESGGQYEFAKGIQNAGNDVILQTPEFNYSFAPNMTTTSFEIGSYALSFGAISIVELLAAIALVGALVGWQFAWRGKKGSKK